MARVRDISLGYFPKNITYSVQQCHILPYTKSFSSCQRKLSTVDWFMTPYGMQTGWTVFLHRAYNWQLKFTLLCNAYQISVIGHDSEFNKLWAFITVKLQQICIDQYGAQYTNDLFWILLSSYFQSFTKAGTYIILQKQVYVYVPDDQWLKAKGIMTYSPGSNMTLHPTKLFNCRLLHFIRVLKAFTSDADSRNTRIHKSSTPLWFSLPLKLSNIKFINYLLSDVRVFLKHNIVGINFPNPKVHKKILKLYLLQIKQYNVKIPWRQMDEQTQICVVLAKDPQM